LHPAAASAVLVDGVVLERQVEGHLARQIAEIYTGDPQTLLDGSVRLEDAFEANINRYLAASFLAQHGFAVRVSVATRSGKILYPSPHDPLEVRHADPRRVAVENFALLSEGLTVRIETRLEHNRLISNAILGVYILAALAALLLHYRSAGRQMSGKITSGAASLTAWPSARRRAPSDSLSSSRNASGCGRSSSAEDRYGKRALPGRAKRGRPDREIETLEEKLAENLGLQDSQQAEIQTFKDKIALLEKEQRREGKGRQKPTTPSKGDSPRYTRISW